MLSDSEESADVFVKRSSRPADASYLSMTK